MTVCTAPIWPCQDSSDKLERITGSPAKWRYCLGKLPPARIPRPAATTTAATEGPIEFPNKIEFFDAGFTAFPDDTKGFPHRSELCCDATLALPQELTKLYARSIAPNM